MILVSVLLTALFGCEVGPAEVEISNGPCPLAGLRYLQPDQSIITQSGLPKNTGLRGL